MAAEQNGGVGGTSFGALSSIGSDLSVSVSFNIARELLDAANDEQISEDELIGLVLGFTIVFTALQSRLRSEIEVRRRRGVEHARASVRSRFETLLHAGAFRSEVPMTEEVKDAVLATLEEDAVQAAVSRREDRRGILEFVFLIVNICQRISVAIAVQLLASSVRAQQPSRLVRTVSLIGLATFFVFVESLTHRTLA